MQTSSLLGLGRGKKDKVKAEQFQSIFNMQKKSIQDLDLQSKTMRTKVELKIFNLFLKWADSNLQ
uniref:Uncharacterized protein n=1 Tax=Solanum tuberosum TaxID=4113 RepID=M1A601_SOLTU